MAKPKQFCPECKLQTLKCEYTIPTSTEGHPLESSRLSVWECTSPACRARFLLSTPEGELRKVGKRAVFSTDAPSMPSS